jgi:DNA modification methylase
MKPISLIARMIKNSTPKKLDVIVLDAFCGSGSTLIACEQLERTCYAMEIDRIFCDVIVKRWEVFTGRKAELFRSENRRTAKLEDLGGMVPAELPG